MEPNQNQNPYQSQQPYQQPQYQPPGGGQYGGDSGRLVRTASPLEFVCAQAVSPVYLAATIAFSLQILFELFSSGSILSKLLSYLSSAMDYASYFSSAMGYTSDYSSSSGLSSLLDMFGSSSISPWALVSNAPDILIAVGLWLLFVSAIRREDPPIKTIGLKIIYVIVIIQLVLTCVSLAGIELVLLYVAKAVGSDGTGYVILFMLLVAAFYIIQIMFYLKLMQTVKCGEMMAEYNQVGEPIVMYVPVCCFIFGGFAVLGMFFGSVMSGLCSATSYIAFGILVLSIRGKIEQLRVGQAVEIPGKAAKAEKAEQPNNSGGYYYNNPPLPGQEDLQRQQEELQRQQEELRRQQQELQRRQQEEMQRRQQEELRRQQQELQRRQQEELRRQQEEMQRRQQEEMQRRQQEDLQSQREILQEQKPDPDPVELSDMGTVVFQEESAGVNSTTVLTDPEAEAQPSAKLVRQKNQEVIAVGGQPFRIGSERGRVDYCIADNRSISRHHADIFYQDGAFYIIDHNSTNHVSLDGQRISSGQPYALQNGMQIRLADEEFIWQQD